MEYEGYECGWHEFMERASLFHSEYGNGTTNADGALARSHHVAGAFGYHADSNSELEPLYGGECIFGRCLAAKWWCGVCAERHDQFSYLPSLSKRIDLFLDGISFELRWV